MANRPLATSRPLIAFLLGLAGALVVVACHLADVGRVWELAALDLRFKYASDAQPPDNILHVDIDDHSLAKIGRWPWPRQTLAEVVAVLNECGARTVALDIIMPESQTVRYVSKANEVLGADDSTLIHAAPPKPVWDDVALMRTIWGCGNIMLPMVVDFAEDDVQPKAPEPLEVRVAEILAAAPRASFKSVLATVLPDLPAHRKTRERDIVENAYLQHRAIKALKRFTIPADQVADGLIDEAPIRPSLVLFSRLIHGSGFVTFRPDPDKSIRRIPLLARSNGLVYPQFALAVAADELARRHGGACKIEADEDTVTLRCTDGTVRSIPVDRRGWMLIHWARATWPPAQGASKHSRISAASVAKLSRERHRRQKIEDQIQSQCVELINLAKERKGKPPNQRLALLYMTCDDLLEAFDQAYVALRDTRRQMLAAGLYDPAKDVELADLKELVEAERDSQTRLAKAREEYIAGFTEGDNLDVFLARPAAGEPSEKLTQFQDAKAKAAEILKTVKSLSAERTRTEANIARLKAELIPIVQGKICMVGSTSTGAADFVPCPLSARTPGVVVHSNIIDTILDGRFIAEAHWAVNVLVILAAGAAVSLVAACRPVVQAALGAGVIAVAYIALNAFVVFGMWSVWLAAVAPMQAMLASFMVVTAYRQLTEERGKRQLKAMLVQTLSPEVVEEVLKDPSLLDPGGQKNALSCMFSDLAGFTPLSEQLGPQDTVRLLNRYFDGATEAIATRWGGWVNKFLGDGIFAIFGVPVRPERHAARAVEAAIDCQQAVDTLNVELTRQTGVSVQLSVRIGITTGEAMVGNCGSTTKADLTAIGDYVNQASRLEASNKSFGTGIIIARQTWESCDGDALLARPLGRIFIVGVSEAVRVWHVLGRTETLGEDLKPALDDFARAMDRFIEQDFAAALALLEKVDRAMPNDKPTGYYMDLCRQCAARPVGDETWRPGHDTKGVARVAMPWQDVNPNEHTK